MLLNLNFSRSILVIGSLGSSSLAMAGYTFKYDDISGEISLSAGAATVSANHVNFGEGRVDQRSGVNTGTQASWQEAFVKPGITLNYKLNQDVDLLAGASVVGARTWGDGDAGGYTHNADGDVALEELYAGVRVGSWKFTAGRQNYIVGTGFIVMDGNLDVGKDGAYYLAPRSAFRNSAILSWEKKALKTQAFTLQTDDHFGGYRMTGVNVDYGLGDKVTLGAMLFKVNASHDRTPTRDGMEVYNFRALNAKIPSIPALTLNGEYALQRGHDGRGEEYDAKAWYVQADYALDQLPLKPIIGYRYTTFSGDKNPTDNKRQDWDSLSKGYIGWGTWLIGDVVGNYLLYNSNERVQQFSVKTHLNEKVTLGGMYYQFWLDQANYFGRAVNERRFADEYAIYLDWTPTANFYTSLSYNWVKPKGAAKQLFGDRGDFNTIELYFTYRY